MAICRRSSASPSKCPQAASSRSSAPTPPARPPRCAWSPAWWPRATAASSSTAATSAAHARRADARPGARARGAHLRDGPHDQRRRRHRVAGRAERPPGAHAGHARVRARIRQAGARGRRPRAARRRASQARVSRFVTMPVYHVHFTCAADYNARRLPYRPAHLTQLTTLRDEGRAVAGGPEPDGSAAHIFYRVADRADLDRLVADNEFQRAGLFVAHAARAFDDFVEPIERLPPDAGWKVTLVEGMPTDRAGASAALTRLRTEKLVNLGGFFADSR